MIAEKTEEIKEKAGTAFRKKIRVIPYRQGSECYSFPFCPVFGNYLSGRLRSLIEAHACLTGSQRAKDILADSENSLSNFVKVFPMEYRLRLGQMTSADAAVSRTQTHN